MIILILQSGTTSKKKITIALATEKRSTANLLSLFPFSHLKHFKSSLERERGKVWFRKKKDDAVTSPMMVRHNFFSSKLPCNMMIRMNNVGEWQRSRHVMSCRWRITGWLIIHYVDKGGWMSDAEKSRLSLVKSSNSFFTWFYIFPSFLNDKHQSSFS